MDEGVLAKLHDIVLPKPIGLWPLAIGWYFVFFMGLILLGLLLFYWHKHVVNALPKREALRHLKKVQQTYLNDGNKLAAIIQLSELLRRVALAYFPKEKVASLVEEDWIVFLNQRARKLDFKSVEDCLLRWPYEAEIKSADPDRLVSHFFALTTAWIKQRGKPCSN